MGKLLAMVEVLRARATSKALAGVIAALVLVSAIAYLVHLRLTTNNTVQPTLSAQALGDQAKNRQGLEASVRSIYQVCTSGGAKVVLDSQTAWGVSPPLSMEQARDEWLNNTALTCAAPGYTSDNRKCWFTHLTPGGRPLDPVNVSDGRQGDPPGCWG